MTDPDWSPDAQPHSGTWRQFFTCTREEFLDEFVHPDDRVYAENVVRAGGCVYAIRRRSQELVPPRRSRPLRHDDRLCYFDWLISV